MNLTDQINDKIDNSQSKDEANAILDDAGLRQVTGGGSNNKPWYYPLYHQMASLKKCKKCGRLLEENITFGAGCYCGNKDPNEFADTLIMGGNPEEGVHY